MNSGNNLHSKKPTVEIQRAPTIAIIDDDIELERAIARVLRANYKCVVNGYSSVEEFLKTIDALPGKESPSDKVDLILLDFHLPGKNGPALVSELEKRNSDILTKGKIMGITADNEPLVYAGFKDAGIEEILIKPLRGLDFSNIAQKAYKICRDLDSVPPKSILSRTI